MTYTGNSKIYTTIQEPRVTNSDDVAELVRSVIGSALTEQEHFVLITLNGNSRTIRAETVFIGTINQSIVHPREIFRRAIVDNACGIIIAHNHPSGALVASRADIQITTRLKEVAKLVGIELLDHVIVTESGQFSFSDEGLL